MKTITAVQAKEILEGTLSGWGAAQAKLRKGSETVIVSVEERGRRSRKVVDVHYRTLQCDNQIPTPYSSGRKRRFPIREKMHSQKFAEVVLRHWKEGYKLVSLHYDVYKGMTKTGQKIHDHYAFEVI